MRKTVLVAIGLALATTIAILAIATHRKEPPPAPVPEAQENPFDVRPHHSLTESEQRAQDKKIEEFCQNCHNLPPADVEPKRLWAAKIQAMYGYAQEARPIPPDRIPPLEDAIRYWTSRAPEELVLPDDALDSPPSPIPFERRLVALDAIPSPPSVSNIRFVHLTDDRAKQLLLCDMRQGVVVLWTPSRPEEPARAIGRTPHPCRTFVADLDGDGLRDVLVANLGDYWPVDTDQGSVVWLRNRGNGNFETVTLFGGLGRVADVQAADFDGDGDLDLVVAVFGNLTTGMLLYLENVTKDYAHPEFEPIPLDRRTGTSDVPIVDLNHDGRPDFLALQAQEHDHVLAFINQGGGNFRQELAYKAPHHRWGSTGLKLVDLDGDGNTDVLYNNGDLVEVPPTLRPYHGCGWLENKGTFPFTYHRLTHMPGDHTSMPADLDGDGRLDIVCSSFIPAFDPKRPVANRLDSVAWLRQVAPGQFKRYSLETGTPFHPCGDLGDIDGDGDVDIVIGNFYMFPAANEKLSSLTVFVNPRLSPVKGKDRAKK